LGFSRTRLAFSSPYNTQSVLSKAGLQNAAGLNGLPGLSFVNFTALSPIQFSQSVDQVKGVTDNLSIFKGAHSLKMGVLFNRSNVFSTALPPRPRSVLPERLVAGTLPTFCWANLLP
jgi:hypothetical protein